ncbi:hypothetical protein TWF506_009232 [Arthrobotrys conoides]|uniref:Ankyrin n=1 Tax=Arthrobotrys conoides TaxID=74498 RepID=A0AAN8PEF6_9PEZI
MHVVAYFGLWGYIDQLLAEGVDIEAANYKGLTPLMIATYDGNFMTVEQLLKRGSNRDARDMTVLRDAASRGYSAIVDVPLRWSGGRGLNRGDKSWGTTPLIKTAERGFADVVEDLVCEEAAKDAHSGNVQFLLSKGANPHSKDED